MWQHIILAWPIHLQLEVVQPCNNDEVLSSSLWWITHFIGWSIDFTRQWAAELMQVGLYLVRDIFDGIDKTLIRKQSAMRSQCFPQKKLYTIESLKRYFCNASICSQLDLGWSAKKNSWGFSSRREIYCCR